MLLHVQSTNTGVPKEYTFKGASVQTSMRRSPRSEGIEITKTHVVGDQFAVAKVHGLPEAAVYALSSDTFEEWSVLLSQRVGVGNFGENLTVAELDESQIMAGDEFTCGRVRLRVSGPRFPCNRLNFVFQREDAQQKFTEFRRPGVYFSVLQEGIIKPGDSLMRSKKGTSKFSVLDLFDALRRRKEGRPEDRELFVEIASDMEVAELFRSRFRQVIAQ